VDVHWEKLEPMWRGTIEAFINSTVIFVKSSRFARTQTANLWNAPRCVNGFRRTLGFHASISLELPSRAMHIAPDEI
jgi:hypothetical protein